MKIRQSWFKRLFHSGVLFYILLVALALVYILPFIIQIATSFKTDAEATANPL